MVSPTFADELPFQPRGELLSEKAVGRDADWDAFAPYASLPRAGFRDVAQRIRDSPRFGNSGNDAEDHRVPPHSCERRRLTFRVCSENSVSSCRLRFVFA